MLISTTFSSVSIADSSIVFKAYRRYLEPLTLRKLAHAINRDFLALKIEHFSAEKA